jgi:hypothetical protein
LGAEQRPEGLASVFSASYLRNCLEIIRSFQRVVSSQSYERPDLQLLKYIEDLFNSFGFFGVIEIFGAFNVFPGFALDVDYQSVLISDFDATEWVISLTCFSSVHQRDHCWPSSGS